jgi:hypothetical protein
MLFGVILQNVYSQNVYARTEYSLNVYSQKSILTQCICTVTKRILYKNVPIKMLPDFLSLLCLTFHLSHRRQKHNFKDRIVIKSTVRARVIAIGLG